MTKGKITFFVCLIVFIVLIVRIPFTPKVEGVVTDTVSGEPIKNAVIKLEWIRLGIMGSRSAYHAKLVVTDEEGHYKTGRFLGLIFFSGFDSFGLKVKHPLYEAKTEGILVVDSLDRGAPRLGRNAQGSRWGTVTCDIKLLGAEEMRKMRKRGEKVSYRGTWSDVRDYFIEAKKMGIPKETLLNYFKQMRLSEKGKGTILGIIQ